MPVAAIISAVGVLIALSGMLITVYKVIRENAAERGRLAAALDQISVSLTKLDNTMERVLERLGDLEIKVAVLEDKARI